MNSYRDPLGHQSIKWCRKCYRHNQMFALVLTLGASIGLFWVLAHFPEYQYEPYNGLLLPLKGVALVAGVIGLGFSLYFAWLILASYLPDE